MQIRQTLMRTLFLGSTVLLTSSAVFADDEGGGLTRLSAEFQNAASLGGAPEIVTNVAPAAGGAGGVVTYDKVVKVPEGVNVIYLHFEGQGDSHNGSTLAMSANLTEGALAPVVIQPAAGGGLSGTAGPTGWQAVLKLPAPTAATNCNDGGGGFGDCHDNSITFSGCWRLQKKTDDGETIEVKIKLADEPGGGGNFAFYERAFIAIDGQRDNSKTGALCKGVGTGKH